MSSLGIRFWLDRKLSPCVSQRPNEIVTTRTPASTSRRAIRKWSMQQGGPSSSAFMSPMPYRARRRGSSWLRSRRLEDLPRGKDLECALGERVHPLHGFGMVEGAAHVVELAQQRMPASQAIGNNRRLVKSQARRAAAQPASARPPTFLRRPERRERGAGQSQIAGVAGVAPGSWLVRGERPTKGGMSRWTGPLSCETIAPRLGLPPCARLIRSR